MAMPRICPAFGFGDSGESSAINQVLQQISSADDLLARLSASRGLSVKTYEIVNSVWKLTTDDGYSFVLRTANAFEDLAFERYVSQVSARVAPGRNTRVRALDENECQTIIQLLSAPSWQFWQTKTRAQLATKLASGREVSVSAFIEADGSRFDRRRVAKLTNLPFEKLRRSYPSIFFSAWNTAFGDASPAPLTGPIVMPPSQLPRFIWGLTRAIVPRPLMMSLAEAWIVRISLHDRDFHRYNWIYVHGIGVGIDMAMPPHDMREDMNPLGLPADIAAWIYAKEASPEFWEGFLLLTPQDLSVEAEHSGFAIGTPCFRKDVVRAEPGIGGEILDLSESASELLERI